LKYQFIVVKPSNEDLRCPFLGGNGQHRGSEFGGFLLSEIEIHARKCTFCSFTAPYDEWPEGSIIFRGIAICAVCLEHEKTKEIREYLDDTVA
jgi:hypothetical protein